MFIKCCKSLLLPIFILVLAGCFGGPSVESGIELEELVELNGEEIAEVFVEKGETFGMDMRDPSNEGGMILGASFDPTMLRMERYLAYEDDGLSRVQYIFTAIADGASEVVVKMKKTNSSVTEVYKRVIVKVGDDSGLF